MKHAAPGAQSQVAVGIAFALWCLSRRRHPTYRDVMAYFGVSRATAYRWLSAWKAAPKAGLP